MKVFHYDILNGKGKISYEIAKEKEFGEYEKYKVVQDKNFVSDFDKLVIENKNIEDK